MRYNGGRILIWVAAPCREPGKGCRRIDRNEFRERADHAQAGSDPGGLHIALLLALGGNTPWRKTGAQQPPYTELFYLSGPLRIQAYLYRPQGDGPFPLVIYNHGSRADREREPRRDLTAERIRGVGARAAR